MAQFQWTRHSAAAETSLPVWFKVPFPLVSYCVRQVSNVSYIVSKLDTPSNVGHISQTWSNFHWLESQGDELYFIQSITIIKKGKRKRFQQNRIKTFFSPPFRFLSAFYCAVSTVCVLSVSLTRGDSGVVWKGCQSCFTGVPRWFSLSLSLECKHKTQTDLDSSSSSTEGEGPLWNSYKRRGRDSITRGIVLLFSVAHRRRTVHHCRCHSI